MPAALLVAGLLATSTTALPVTVAPPSPWAGYLDQDALETRLRSIAGPNASVEVLGRSRAGRPIHVLTLANDPADATRPAVLVVAGLDARHQAGTEYAVRAAETLIADHRELLDEVTVHVVPRLNPDGTMALRGAVNDGGRGGRRPIDADRDGLLDEDPPRDLDGDGVITMMRIADPPLGMPATHLPDPAEPRLMRTPDTSKGERASHAIMIEGVDADRDGRVGEDGHGEVRFDHNFMHLYEANSIDSGPFQLSEPETLALAEFVLDHPTIMSAVVFGPHDTLINLPEMKKNDITGRQPIGILEDDKSIFEAMQAAYADAVGQTRTGDEEDSGSLHGWLYAHRGIPTAAVTGWGRPDLPGSEETGTEPSEDDTDTAPEPTDADAAGWLAWSDRVRDGGGFVEWHPFEHPEFGAVEIGGWVPGFTSNPPASELDELGRRQAAFIAALATMRPKPAIEGPEVEDLGGGIVRIRFAIRNDGDLPMRTAMSRRSRAIRPMAVRISTDRDRILQGAPLTLVDELDGKGGRREFSWVVRTGDAPDTIILDDPQFGERTIEIPAASNGADR